MKEPNNIRRAQYQNTILPYSFFSGIPGQCKYSFKMFYIELFKGSCVQYPERIPHCKVMVEDMDCVRSRVWYWTKEGCTCFKVTLWTEVVWSRFRALISERLHDLGYRPSISDPGVWMIPAVKLGGFIYYEYVLFYVDYVLCISDDPLCTMKGIQAKLKLKGYKIEKLDMYLGAYFSKTTNIDGQECWGISSDKYCMEAVTNV